VPIFAAQSTTARWLPAVTGRTGRSEHSALATAAKIPCFVPLWRYVAVRALPSLRIASVSFAEARSASASSGSISTVNVGRASARARAAPSPRTSHSRDRCERRIGLQPPHHLGASHDRHHHVDEHEVRAAFRERLEPELAVDRDVDVVALVDEEIRHHVGQAELVVDYEDVRLHVTPERLR
jgi:hypothetical protein